LIFIGAIIVVLALSIMMYLRSDQSDDEADNKSVLSFLQAQQKTNTAITNNGQLMDNSHGSEAVSPSTITIAEDSFDPAVVQIKTGDVVTWSNSVQAEHSIQAETFSSGNLRQNETFSYQFSGVGTFYYSCGLHPDIIGQVIVK